MSIRFLNVDLEVQSHKDLGPIAADFGEDVLTLYCGDAHTHKLALFETAVSYGDPDTTISHFCTMIEGMSADVRSLWTDSFSKVFDIGYESGLSSQKYSSELRPDIVARVAAIGASIRVTIYPPMPEKKDEDA